MNSPPKILVIDDNTALLESLRRLLLDAGYVPEVATTGQAGLDMAYRTNPDLILLDVVLPDVSGVEICRTLKTAPPSSRPLVALMSGMVTDSNQQAAGIEAGADEYLCQPMGSRELRARVKALLRLKRAEDGLTQLNQELEKRVEQRTAQLECVNGVLLQEIAERQRAEAALRKSEQYAKSIIECSRDMIITVDNDRRIVEFNKAAQACFGYPREEIVGQSVNQLYADQQESQTVHERTCQQGKLSREILNRRKNGELFPCFLSASALRNAQGELLGMVGVSRDVTEEKQAEAEHRNWEAKLQQIQKLESLGVMAGGIAHDFNNLLTAILGHADLALADLPPESPVREGLHEIKQASLRAAAICQQMLACSGKGRFTVQPADLSDLVREITQLIKASISKKVSVRYHLAEHVPVIEADPAQVNQLVINLVINASESIADQEGVIDISTGTLQCDANYLKHSHFIDLPPEGTYVFLEIGDTGCGMDPETQARIFDPFFTTKFLGRGLGLAAALGIVRAHKGAVRVESRSGQGTVFRVLFPVSKNATPRLLGTLATPDAWRGSGTILLVDDEEPVRNVCKPMLERYGFSVLTAPDGREAIRLFQEHHESIVCVLLDLTMPRLGGAETYRELRRIQGDARVILASGYSESEITQRFADLGFSGFIQKPYQMTTLIGKLRGTLEPSESKR